MIAISLIALIGLLILHLAVSQPLKSADFEKRVLILEYDANVTVHNTSFDINFHGDLLEYEDVTWQTPLTLGVRPIINATMTRNGMVFNASQKYTFNKWYFQGHISPSQIVRVHDSGIFFSFVQVWQNIYQHITFDTIPRIRILCSTLQKQPDIGLLVMGTLQRDLMIEACPLEQKRFKIITEPYSASVIAPVVWLPGTYAMGIVPPNSFRSLGPQDVLGTRVLYIPRKSNERRVANEDSVIKILRNHFKERLLVYNPVNNWKEDRKVFSDARLIIGPHGGAMGNMIFAPANTTIIEFLSLTTLHRKGENSRPCYFGLANGMGFKYSAIEPIDFSFHGPMTIPEDKLSLVLQTMI